jgi:acetoacetyl-CoA synthetase
MFVNGPPNKNALIAAREGGADLEYVTYQQLHDKVQQLACAMRCSGIKKGDRIAVIISNSVAAFVICLATLAIGAIYSSSATGPLTLQSH